MKNSWKKCRQGSRPGKCEVLEKGEHYPEDKIVKLKKNFHLDYEQRFNVPIAEDCIDLKRNNELFFYFINGRTPSEADAKHMNAMIRFDSKYFAEFSAMLRQRSSSVSKKSKVDEVVSRLSQVKKPVFKQKNLESMGSVSPNPRRSASQARGASQSSVSGASKSKPVAGNKPGSKSKLQSLNQSSNAFRQTSRTRNNSPINSILERLSGFQTDQQPDNWKHRAEQYVDKVRKRTSEKENDRHAPNLQRQSKVLATTSIDGDYREISNLNYTNYQRGMSVEYSKKRSKERLEDQKTAMMKNLNVAMSKNLSEHEANRPSRLSIDTAGQRLSVSKLPFRESQNGLRLGSVEDQGYQSGLLESADETYN